MPKSWDITLGTKELDGLIKDLTDYRNSLKRKLDEACEAIAQAIRDEAQQGFDGAWVNDVHEPVQVSVTVEVNPGKTTFVVASGEEAAFVEFGAGISWNGASGTSPHPKGQEIGYTIGSYGKGMGNRKAWGYYDGAKFVITHGTVAQMPLYNAMLKIEPHIPLIIRSIFDD